MILNHQTPPSEFYILSEGDIPTEYGAIPVTREAIVDCVNRHKQRRRQVSSDFEHKSNPKRNPNPTIDDLASPAYFSLESREQNGKLQLWAVNAVYTERGARAVGSGEFRWFSPEFRPNTDFQHVMDLKKISFTNDPAMHTNPKLLFSINEREPMDEKKPSADAVEPAKCLTSDNEVAENTKYKAISEALAAILGRTDLPEDIATQMQTIAGLITDLQSTNAEEQSAAPVEAAVTDDQKKTLSIVASRFGNLTSAQLEAKLFAMDISDREIIRKTDIEEKRAVLLSCIENGQISPHNKAAHQKFLSLSVDAAHAFASSAPSVKRENAIQPTVEKPTLMSVEDSPAAILRKIGREGVSLFDISATSNRK